MVVVFPAAPAPTSGIEPASTAFQTVALPFELHGLRSPTRTRTWKDGSKDRCVAITPSGSPRIWEPCGPCIRRRQPDRGPAWADMSATVSSPFRCRAAWGGGQGPIRSRVRDVSSAPPSGVGWSRRPVSPLGSLFKAKPDLGSRPGGGAADGAGFGPADPVGSAALEAAAFDRSANHPRASVPSMGSWGGRTVVATVHVARARGRGRTCDARFRKPALCPLSYRGGAGVGAWLRSCATLRPFRRTGPVAGRER